MNSEEIDKIITQNIQNPNQLQVLLNRRDDYGDSMLEKTLEKIAFTEEIASSFGFNPTIASSIAAIYDLSFPCYGKIGEEFLSEIDQDYSRGKYAAALTKKILHGINSKSATAIALGVENIANGIDTTPEEKIAIIVNSGFEFSDSLRERAVGGVFVYKYKDLIIQKTKDSGKLTGHTIPQNSLPKRNKINQTEAEKVEKMRTLKTAHKYFLENFDKIPESFKNGWTDISDELLAAYYIVSTDDKFLEKFSRPPKDNKEDTEVEL